MEYGGRHPIIKCSSGCVVTHANNTRYLSDAVKYDDIHQPLNDVC